MDSKEGKEILNIFNIADELSVLRLLEYPINKIDINIDKNYIKDIHETPFSLEELIYSYLQFTINPEDKFSLNLRIFSGDNVIENNSCIFIQRGELCKSFIKKNLFQISNNFIQNIEIDIKKHIFFKKEINDFFTKNKEHFYFLDKNKIVNLMDFVYLDKLTRNKKTGLMIIEPLIYPNSKSEYIVLLNKVLYTLLENKTERTEFSKNYKTSLIHPSILSLNGELIYKNNIVSENFMDFYSFLSTTAKFFPIVSIIEQNNKTIFKRDLKNIDYIPSVIKLSDIRYLFSNYILHQADLLVNIDDLKSALLEKDYLSMIHKLTKL